MEGETVDWTAVRDAALKCLGAVVNLVSFAEHAQAGYDTADAVTHLMVFRKATEALVEAVHQMGRGFFDYLALASVGEGPRPDFHFGKVSCATAHETAFRLLHAADTELTEQLRAALRETGLDAQVNVNHLEQLSPEDLRKTLTYAARSGQLVALDPEGSHLIRSWIDREWAAVSRAATIRAKDLLLTAPLTKKQLAAAFDCHRNQVDKLVLAKYPHERDGTKFRMHVAVMPAEWRAKHGLS